MVADEGWGVTYRFVSGSFGLPAQHLLGPGAVVIATNTWVTEAQIEDALP